MLEGKNTQIKKDIKPEILKRYQYLYENKELILSLCISEGIEEKHYKECLKEARKSLRKFQHDKLNNQEIEKILTSLEARYKAALHTPQSYLMNQIPVEILNLLEEFLFSNSPLEDTALYKEIECIKSDELEMAQAEYQIESLMERRRKNEFLKERNPFTVWRILDYVRNNNQDNADILDFLDIFYNLDRTITSGLNWESGYGLTDYDMEKNEEYLNNLPRLSKMSGFETKYASSFIMTSYKGNEFEVEDDYFACQKELDQNPPKLINFYPSEFVYSALRISEFTEEEKMHLYTELQGQTKKYSFLQE